MKRSKSCEKRAFVLTALVINFGRVSRRHLTNNRYRRYGCICVLIYPCGITTASYQCLRFIIYLANKSIRASGTVVHLWAGGQGGVWDVKLWLDSALTRTSSLEKALCSNCSRIVESLPVRRISPVRLGGFIVPTASALKRGGAERLEKRSISTCSV